MRNFTLSFLAAAAACLACGSAQAQTYMPEATLDYPAGLYAAFAPSSVSITWDQQPIELVDPHTNDFDEECVTVYVQLGEGEQQPVDAGILYSFGDPENPDDGDVWCLDIALYNLDDLWDFDGNTVKVIIPENVVKNSEGAINPAQEFLFEIMPTFTEYSIDPESGSTLSDNMTVIIGFGGNPIEYLQSEVRAMTYEPEYRDITLKLGEEVKITENNEVEIDLSNLEAGFYELVVPEGFVAVTVDGARYLSPDIWLEYTLEGGDSGIDAIASDAAKAVYTIDGRRVSDLDKAASGIYVINGKKVIVKK